MCLTLSHYMPAPPYTLAFMRAPSAIAFYIRNLQCKKTRLYNDIDLL